MQVEVQFCRSHAPAAHPLEGAYFVQLLALIGIFILARVPIPVLVRMLVLIRVRILVAEALRSGDQGHGRRRHVRGDSQRQRLSYHMALSVVHGFL